MNLEKCDKCGNRNIMCFLCENNKHYRETKYSHNNFIRNKAIDEFAERLKNSLQNNYRNLLNVDTDGFEWLTTDAVGTHIDEIAEKMKGGATDERTGSD